MSIPETLLNAMHAKRVVPFIGAGFSRDFGYPSLLLSITRHDEINITLTQKETKGRDPLEIAESL